MGSGSEHEFLIIALEFKRFGDLLIGEQPIPERMIQIGLTNLKKHAYRFPLALEPLVLGHFADREPRTREPRIREPRIRHRIGTILIILTSSEPDRGDKTAATGEGDSVEVKNVRAGGARIGIRRGDDGFKKVSLASYSNTDRKQQMIPAPLAGPARDDRTELMQRRRLGGSGVVVSDICMGTMTFGTQCDESTSHAICDRAWDAGIDFFDTAELYPVPPSGELAGISEEIVGRWLKTRRRESVVIATKVTGPGHGWFTPPIRHGKTSLDRHQIIRACDASLQRLQTDYIDLYQTHWPDHGMPYEEVLGALTDLRDAGKVRVIGCSNETSWGLMKSLWAAETCGLDRYQTVQNNFSLINRRCESELAQVCRRESVSLLPYSPLGGGVLTGKYRDGAPDGARFTAYLREGNERQEAMARRFVNDRTVETASRIGEIAESIGTTPTALSVAWSRQHDFIASTIIGATSLAQLEESLSARDLVLDEETMRRIDQVDVEIPNPMTEDGLRRL